MATAEIEAKLALVRNGGTTPQTDPNPIGGLAGAAPIYATEAAFLAAVPDGAIRGARVGGQSGVYEKRDGQIVNLLGSTSF